eukprot:scaffold7885_cov403-Prasinococcus_capsulatus_cf.AAC.7
MGVDDLQTGAGTAARARGKSVHSINEVDSRNAQARCSRSMEAHFGNGTAGCVLRLPGRACCVVSASQSLLTTRPSLRMPLSVPDRSACIQSVITGPSSVECRAPAHLLHELSGRKGPAAPAEAVIVTRTWCCGAAVLPCAPNSASAPSLRAAGGFAAPSRSQPLSAPRPPHWAFAAVAAICTHCATVRRPHVRIPAMPANPAATASRACGARRLRAAAVTVSIYTPTTSAVWSTRAALAASTGGQPLTPH